MIRETELRNDDRCLEGAYHMKNASQSHWGYPMCWSPENVSPVTSGILWSFPGRLVFCDLCCNSPQALDGPGNDVLTGQRQVWSHCNGIELGEEPNPVSCSPRKDDVSFEFCFKSSGTLGHALRFCVPATFHAKLFDTETPLPASRLRFLHQRELNSDDVIETVSLGILTYDLNWSSDSLLIQKVIVTGKSMISFLWTKRTLLRQRPRPQLISRHCFGCRRHHGFAVGFGAGHTVAHSHRGLEADAVKLELRAAGQLCYEHPRGNTSSWVMQGGYCKSDDYLQRCAKIPYH